MARKPRQVNLGPLLTLPLKAGRRLRLVRAMSLCRRLRPPPALLRGAAAPPAGSGRGFGAVVAQELPRAGPPGFAVPWLRPRPPAPARVAAGGRRGFCAVAEALLPAGLRRSPHVTLRLHKAGEQLAPSKDGKRSVGVSDRGAGLVYRGGGRPASSDAIEGREAAGESLEGVWVVKIQPPLDVSSDSAGGIGKITPATLLLNDRKWRFMRFVKEEDDGHFPLLRCALSEPGQVAYLFAEQVEDKGPVLRVFTQERPAPQLVGW
ncbi:unnamed protein product [Prorocentrum cordatum]|uniref:Uncharacterized protein n=1 Tax=Prorocentrum cordatum TaxID=2364126 RepID=A0ABN9V2H8_9DINO|nr:unnamed protein product [Polarella glacialis]